MSKLSETFRRLWATAPGNPARKPFVLHDPAAKLPRDLDDPFLDQKVQERIAKAIAKAAQK